MRAEVVLVLANIVYATSYVATRLTLDDIPPSALALTRLVIGALILVPLAVALRKSDAPAFSRADRGRIFWMGALGFAGAFALSHWGLARSTATNGALLITVEPITMLLLAPVLLGERLTFREKVGAGLALLGAAVVIANGIPGVSQTLVPHWRGDLLLILAGVAYASYSLIGREILARHSSVSVTAGSIVWGAVTMLPLAVLERAAGAAPRLTPLAIVGTLYLAVVITALGYLAWNYALERVPASRAAIFLNLQPLGGALLGVGVLGEPLTPYIVAGGALILAGLTLTVKGQGKR
ncbi:MAG TPA: EamA family transporter [Candidatus Nitrosocosmicus sp.]|nr:EamA family transporter [Candidatus Nitrosocosmicus sp.]